MQNATRDFIQALPKGELHVHLKGSLEPEHIFTLAQRNGIELEYATPDEMVAAVFADARNLGLRVDLNRLAQVH